MLDFILKTKKNTYLILWLITLVIFGTIMLTIGTSEPSGFSFMSYLLFFDFFVGIVVFFLLVYRETQTMDANFKKNTKIVSSLHSITISIWLLCVCIFSITMSYVTMGPGSQKNTHSNNTLSDWILLLTFGAGLVSYLISLFTPIKKESFITETFGVTQVQKSDKLEDILFVPKKKKNKTLIWFLISTISILLVIFVYGILSALVSNDFGELPVENTSEIFPIGLLEVRDMSSRWVGNTMYVKATIKNNTDKIASNIMVRMDCYQDKNLTQIFDTRYIEITGVAARGAFTFEEPVQINHVGQFWYNLRIESAD